jgi:hypothetical protein
MYRYFKIDGTDSHGNKVRKVLVPQPSSVALINTMVGDGRLANGKLFDGDKLVARVVDGKIILNKGNK